MRPDPAKDYWFPAKTYGWGWGWPRRWPGWVVTIVWLLLLPVLVHVADPVRHPVAFCVGLGVHVALILGVCWWKGEPPRWRWGGE
jgi:hypothetical protein